MLAERAAVRLVDLTTGEVSSAAVEIGAFCVDWITVRSFRPIAPASAAAGARKLRRGKGILATTRAAKVMGESISATVLTLLFLPALYAAWFRVRRPAA